MPNGARSKSLKNAKSHFGEWKRITGTDNIAMTAKAFEVYRVFVRDESDQLWSVPLGGVFIHLVRNKAVPNRKLKPEAKVHAESSSDEEENEDPLNKKRRYQNSTA